MKYLRQFSLILAITLVGEVLHYFIPLPIPAGIYGLVLLFVGLLTGLIPLEKVKDAGKFFIQIMPVMFIPAGVGLIAGWDTLRPILLPAVLVTLVTLVTVMLAAGRVSQAVIRRGGKEEKE